MKTFSIIVIAVLAGTTAYFASKSIVLQQHLSRRDAKTTATSPSVTPTASPTTPTTSTPSASPSPLATVTSTTTTITPTVARTERLSQPAQTHTVAEGETLSPIGAQYEINWQRIADANTLAEPFKLTIGQILAIPSVVDQAKKIVELKFSTEAGKATSVQKTVDGGKDTWRLDPAATALAELAGYYGVTTDSPSRIDNRNDETGIAQLTINDHQVTLVEPATKGSKGIWAISSIRPKPAQ